MTTMSSATLFRDIMSCVARRRWSFVLMEGRHRNSYGSREIFGGQIRWKR